MTSKADDDTKDEVRRLFSGMQSCVSAVVATQLPILSKDARDALSIKVTQSVRDYLSEAFYS